VDGDVVGVAGVAGVAGVVGSAALEPAAPEGGVADGAPEPALHARSRDLSWQPASKDTTASSTSFIRADASSRAPPPVSVAAGERRAPSSRPCTISVTARLARVAGDLVIRT
jgi:hypothetical protein